jgi:hypothetical protein
LKRKRKRRSRKRRRRRRRKRRRANFMSRQPKKCNSYSKVVAVTVIILKITALA